MRKTILKVLSAFLLFLLALAGCTQAKTAPASAPSAKPWPTHEPGATPYVRTVLTEGEPVPAEAKTYESVEALWNDIYEEFGRFYARKDDLELFRALPQDEVFSFVPHSPHFSLDAGEALRMAMLFDGLEGCEARVIASKQIVDGQDDWGFLTVVTMTPAKLFELSEELDETYMFEQFYPSVEDRFDIAYWPDGLYEEEEKALQSYEKRGCFCFEEGTLKELESLARDETRLFALQSYTPNGWSENGQQLFWLLQYREGPERVFLSIPDSGSKSLCLAEMDLVTLSVLSDELPGHYLVHLADKEMLRDGQLLTFDPATGEVTAE